MHGMYHNIVHIIHKYAEDGRSRLGLITVSADVATKQWLPTYIRVERVALFAADVDGREEAEVGTDAGYPLLHLLRLFDLL